MNEISAAPAQQGALPPPPGPFTVISAIMLPMFLGMIDQTIVATALRSITDDLGGFNRVAWIVTVYLAAAAISAPVYGRLGDAIGRRRMMAVALSISLAGSLLCAVAPTFETLIGARIVQGLGGGGLVSLAQALIAQSLPLRMRARYQGYLATIGIVASTLGPTAGGFLTEHFGWRTVFFCNVPVAFLALALLFRLPPRRTPRVALRFDWLGLALLAITVALLFAIMEGLRASALSNPGQIALAVGILLATGGVLVLRERRFVDPLFPLALFSNRTIALSFALALCHGALYVSLFTFAPLYYALVWRFSPAEAGLYMVPLAIGVGVGSIATGQLVSLTGRTMVFPATGLGIIAAILMAMAIGSDALTPMIALACLTAASTLIGTVMGVVNLSVQSEAHRAMFGIASATISLSRSLGGALGAAFAGAVMVYGLSGASQPGRAFAAIFAVLAAYAAMATTVALAVPRRTLE